MDPTLRALVDLRESFQHTRIAFGLRVGALERGADTSSPIVPRDPDGLPQSAKALFSHWEEVFNGLEKDAESDIRKLAALYPIIPHMIQVKGIGFLLAARVVSLIDIQRSPTVSALWRYAGLGLNPEGKRDRPTKGEKLAYNARLKVACYLVETSFLRSKSPYAAVYYEARAHYEQTHPDGTGEASEKNWTKGHRDYAAKRKMGKLFLSHLWTHWRALEGLPLGLPYAFGPLQHDPAHYRTPQEFGWPEVNWRPEPPRKKGRKAKPVSLSEVPEISEVPLDAEQAEALQLSDIYLEPEA